MSRRRTLQRQPARAASHVAAATGAALLVLLAACESGPPVREAPITGPRSAADQRAATPAALATEQQWLASWFKDTPVEVRLLGDGSVQVEVPREFSFDAGRSTIKPALAAVLDKFAQSARRVPGSRVTLAAPADAATPAAGVQALVTQRVARIRERLTSRGVLHTLVATRAETTADVVRLRLLPAQD